MLVRTDKSAKPQLVLVKRANAREVATGVCEARLAFLQSLPTYGTFGRGWANRVAAVEKAAFDMAS